MEEAALKEFMVELLSEVLAEEGADLSDGVSVSSTLTGEGALVGSLTLVSFVSDLEQALEERYGVEVTLVNEEALSRTASPFRTVGTLGDYVLDLVGGEGARP